MFEIFPYNHHTIIMDNKHQKIVISAIKDIFKELCIPIDRIEIKNESNRINEIITNIGISGNLKGNFLMLSNLKSAKHITSHLLNRSSIPHSADSFDEIDKAAFGELANQLSARVVMHYSENNIDCTITPPTIITGKNVKSLIFGLTEFFYSNIIGQFGYIDLLFGIK